MTMVPIEDSGADTNDAVLRDREQGQHMSRPSIPSPTRFLLQWVTASLLGAGVVATLGAAMLGSNAYFPPWRLALFLGLVALGVGAGQGVVIARLWASSPRPILLGVWWTLGTGIGLGIGGGIGLLLMPVLFVVIFFTVAGGDYHWVYESGYIPIIVTGTAWAMVAAAIVSLVQQLLMEFVLGIHRHAMRLWTLFTVAAWGVGTAAGCTVLLALPAIPILQGAVGGVVGGLIVGVITGLAMLRIVSGGGSAGDDASPKVPEAEG